MNRGWRTLAFALTFLLLPAAALAQTTVSIELDRDRDKNEIRYVYEGGTATFVVRASPAPSTALSVVVRASVEHDVIHLVDPDDSSLGGTVSTTVEIPADTPTVKVSFQVEDNEFTNEARLTATVLERNGDHLTALDSVNMHILDNDSTMELDRNIVSSVTEGGSVTFTLRASSPSAQEREVNVLLSIEGDFGFLGEAPRKVAFAIGTTTHKFIVMIEDDNHRSDEGSVKMQLKDGSSYDVAGSPRDSHSRPIVDNDPSASPYVTPTITISPDPDWMRDDGNLYVKEGSVANFILTSDIPVTATIWPKAFYTTTEGFSLWFQPEGNPKWGSIAIGETSGTLAARQAWNSNDQADGTLTLTLREQDKDLYPPGGAYEIGTPSSASVNVLDDDTRMSITAEAGVEGGSVTFTVTASDSSLVPRDVNVELSANGVEIIGETNRVANIPAASTTAIIVVELGDNNIVNPSGGTVTAKVVNRDERGGEEQLYRLTGETQHTAIVRDDDVDDLRLRNISGSAGYEGGSASITLTSSHIASEAYDVTMVLSIDVGDYELEGETMTQVTRTVQFNPNSTSSVFTFDIAEDTVAEEAGRLAVRVVAVPGTSIYGVDIEASSITLDILDNDATVSIAPAAEHVYEGRTARFILTASHAAPADRTVRVQLEVVEGVFRFWLEHNNPREGTIPADATTAEFNVNMQSDREDTDGGTEVPEVSGRLRVTLLDRDTYELGEQASATMVLLDDDVEFSIPSASSSSVMEGRSVTFTLVASHTATVARPVNVALSVDGGFRIAGDSPRAVEFPADTVTSTFVVMVENDDLANPSGGTLAAQVQDHGDYNLGTPARHTVTVQDNDTNAISVSVSSPSVDEGGSVTFTLSATLPASAAYDVNVAVEVESGVNITTTPAIPAEGVEFPANQTAFMFDVMVEDDEIGTSATLTVTIQDGTAYEVGATPSVTVDIIDNDGDPDVNASGSVDANDALILYYAYSLRNDLGTGR